MARHILDRLHETVLSRKGADPASSYTAKLYARGRDKIGQKIGEEGVECAIEVVKGDADKLVEESADLLYHLTVGWAACGVDPQRVWDVLETRAQANKGEAKGKK